MTAPGLARLLHKLASLEMNIILLILAPLSAPELARLACVHRNICDAVRELRRKDPLRYDAPLPLLLNAGRLLKAALWGDLGIAATMTTILPTDTDSHHSFWGAALVHAATNGNTDLMQLCFSMGADPDVYNGQPLIQAALCGCLAAVNMLLDRNAHLSLSEDTILAAPSALVAAAANGHGDVVITIVHEGVCDRPQLNAALYAACGRGCLSIVRFLINNGADPMHPSSNPDFDADPYALTLVSGGVLLVAARSGHERVVTALLRTGLFKGRWVLHHAIIHH